MTTAAQRLRQKLLDLAIRGKLVPQNPKDEPAEKLLARIREGEMPAALTQRTQSSQRGAKVSDEIESGEAASEKLCDSLRPLRSLCQPPQGKEESCLRQLTQRAQSSQRNTKRFTPIADDEKPFAIPPTWTWCRLGEIAESFSAKPYQILESKIAKVGTFPVVSQGQKFIDGYCNDETKVCGCVVGADHRAARNHDATADHNCGAAGVRALPVIVFGDHTRNVKYIDFPFVVGADGTKLFRSFVDPKWMFYWTLYAATIAMESRGYGRHWNVLCGLPIPLPPLAEQKRIVAALEGMLKAADVVATGMERIAALKDKARAKILDLAIRGKLVEQDAADEPAEKLLARIRRERNSDSSEATLTLRHSKKTRNVSGASDKSEFQIPDDEKPFDIPQSWAWCRGRELFVETETKLPHGASFDYIDIDAIDNKHHRILSPKHLAVSKAPSRASRGLKAGDTLFSIVRPYLENIAFVSMEHKDCIASTGFFICRSCGAMTPEFMFMLMTTPYVIRGLNAFMKGDNSPSIRKDDILNFIFPLPPLAEQQRIVAKVDEMLAACDALTQEFGSEP